MRSNVLLVLYKAICFNKRITGGVKMIEYSMNGAWGAEIPDEQLLERMADFGIEMSVERRKDNLLTIKMCIDNEKIMKRRKRKASTKKQ